MTDHPSGFSRRSLTRPLTTLGLAILVPLSTQFARLCGSGTPEVERAADSAGPVTPAPGTFVIWGPLFAASITCAGAEVRAARCGHERAPGRGWVDVTLIGNLLWSLNAQYRQLDAVSVALIAASAAAATTAVVAATPERGACEHPTDATVRATIGPLAGWLTLATAANLETALNQRSGRPGTTRENLRAALLLAATTTVAGVIDRRALRANPGYRLAVGWGFAGVAVGALRAARDER